MTSLNEPIKVTPISENIPYNPVFCDGECGRVFTVKEEDGSFTMYPCYTGPDDKNYCSECIKIFTENN